MTNQRPSRRRFDNGRDGPSFWTWATGTIPALLDAKTPRDAEQRYRKAHGVPDGVPIAVSICTATYVDLVPQY